MSIFCLNFTSRVHFARTATVRVLLAIAVLLASSACGSSRSESPATDNPDRPGSDRDGEGGAGGSSADCHDEEELERRCDADGNVELLDSCGEVVRVDACPESFGQCVEGQCQCNEGGTVRVSGSADGGERNGSSWSDALQTIEEGLEAAAAHKCDVWVKAGTYIPQEGPNGPAPRRSRSFQIPEGVTLYGGFDGDEERLEERDFDKHVTILSGDLEGDDDDSEESRAENVYTVVLGAEGASLDGLTITGGNASASMERCEDTRKYDKCEGGGLFTSEAAMSVRNCVFRQNRAYHGGAIRSDGDLELSSSAFLDNIADGRGGLVRGSGGSVYASGSVVATDVVFSGNSARGAGGGLYTGGATCTISRCTFSDNRGSDGSALYLSGYGSVEFSMEDSVVANNDAKGEGALWIYADKATIRGSEFTSNRSDFGGAIKSGSDLVLEDSRFNDNRAAAFGGALSLSGSNTITGCTFADNRAETAGGAIDYGQGFSHDLEVRHSLFTGNEASQGGAINVDFAMNMLVSDSTLTNNTANDGGAIYHSYDSLTIERSRFLDNEARGEGGAIYGEHSLILVENSLFARNSATTGGALRSYNSQQRLLRQNTFVSNLAEWGPVFQVGSGVGASIENSILWGNVDTSGAGIIARDDGNPIGVSIAFSNVQGGCLSIPGAACGSGNLDVPPYFTDAAQDDYSLSATSACMDAGSNELVTVGATLDLAGAARIADGDGDGVAIVDMGAHERAPL